MKDILAYLIIVGFIALLGYMIGWLVLISILTIVSLLVWAINTLSK